MFGEILISKKSKQLRLAILKGNEVLDFYFWDEGEKGIVDSIYKGRVESILPGLNAAFIDIGLEKNGFIYLSELDGISISYKGLEEYVLISEDRKVEDILKLGQEIIVQLRRPPINEKGARLTTNISIAGNKCILIIGKEIKAVSNRIKDEGERTRLWEILGNWDLPKGKGVILRTAVRGVKEELIKKEYQRLLDIWEGILKNSQRVKAPCLLYQEDLLEKFIKDWVSLDVNRVLIDDEEVYRNVERVFEEWCPEYMHLLSLEEGDLFLKRGLDKKIRELSFRKVYLKSGAYFTIDKTEGMIVIDVNSGSFTGFRNERASDLEHTAYVVNREAAKEIAKHVRWRDLSGIILIDFIYMLKPEHRKEVEKVFREEMGKDRARKKILPLSDFCIIEMTRESVKDKYEDKGIKTCPHCKGFGFIEDRCQI